MTEQTDKLISVPELIQCASSRFSQPATSHLIQKMPSFIRLLSAKLCSDLLAAEAKGVQQITFWNFWSISWEPSVDKRTGFGHMKATLTRPSAARKLNLRFNNGGLAVTDDMADYFVMLLSKPPMYLPALQSMTQMAQEPGSHYPKDFFVGSNLSYLLRVLFTTILVMTFEHKAAVQLPGIGRFDLVFKNKAREGVLPQNGVLQFTPAPSS